MHRTRGPVRVAARDGANALDSRPCPAGFTTKETVHGSPGSDRRHGVGGAPAPAGAAAARWLARAWAALVCRPVAGLLAALCGLVALVVSQDNSCRYCFGAQ